MSNLDIKNSIEQVSSLVYEGVNSKFTRKLFSDQEVLKVITSFCIAKILIQRKKLALYVAVQNIKAYQLYEKLGFRIIKKQSVL